MSHDKQMKAVSPFYNKQLIFLPSSVELVLISVSGPIRLSLAFKSPNCQHINRPVSRDHHFLSLQILQTVVLFRCSDIRCRCLYLPRHIVGTIYNYIGIVIGYAIAFTWCLYGPNVSVCRQQAHL